VGGSEVRFHVADGGVVCDGCCTQAGGTLRIHRGTLRALEAGLRLDLDRLDRLAMSRQCLDEARRLLGDFQRFHIGVELKSGPFLDWVLRSPGSG
jgi:recombinational DNA repair protein (RecF pathway)